MHCLPTSGSFRFWVGGRCLVLVVVAVGEAGSRGGSYLGFGTLSSGTGVHVESGDFCSLKRPVKATAMSAMS